MNTKDVQFLVRRSRSLLRYITEKNEEIAQFNLEEKHRRMKLEDENKNSMESAKAE